MSNILFYINAIHHGGAERVMVNLASGLTQKGHNCCLVTSFEDTWEYELDSSVKRYNLSDNVLSRNFIQRNILLTKNLRKLIKRLKPDCVISFMAEPNFRALIAGRGIRCKKIISVRNDPNREYPNMLFKIIAKNLYHSADGVVFQTEDAKKWFSNRIQNRSIIIPNQVNISFFTTALSNERADIVTTGRLVEQKNHKLLIRAFKEISNDISDNLHIYGDGDNKEELSSLIKELGLENRVFLEGASKNIVDVLAKAKMFVLSSDFEGMPNSLLEAMAMGLPCISTDCPCGGPREVMKDVADKLLVPVGDTEQLAKLLKEIILDEEKLDLIGNELKEKAQSFHPDVIINIWNDYINSVVEDR